MLARAAPDIPREGSWLYEPKWDGFRAIVFRDGPNVHIASRNALALERYFPELIEPLKAALPERSIVDGEVVIATDHGLDFDALQQRIHPAASRVRMLAEKTPASVVLFDLLGLDDDDLRERPLTERRSGLMRAVASSADGRGHAADHRPGRGDHLVHPLRGGRARRRRRQGTLRAPIAPGSGAG